MSETKLHRPSKEFLGILRSVGAEGEIFTRQQVLFYLREYVIVNRLLDPDNPKIVLLQGDPLAGLVGRPKFAIDEIESLIDEIPSRFAVPRLCEGLAAPLSNFSQTIKTTSLPFSISSSHLHSATSDLTRQRASSSIADEFLNESYLQHTSITLPLLTFPSTFSSTNDSQEHSPPTSPHHSLQPSWPPWFRAVQRLTTTSVTSDEKSEVLSLQGYETAAVEDSSDDLWYLGTSPSYLGTSPLSEAEARGVATIEEVEDDFQVEFEVDSDTEVDEELEEEADEEEEDSEEEEALLGEENDDFAFLSRVAEKKRQS